MPVKYFSNIDLDKGINTYLPTPKTVWSTGKDVRFRPGQVVKSNGKSLLQLIPNESPIRALFSYRPKDEAPNQEYTTTIVCTDTKIYRYWSIGGVWGSYYDLTPAAGLTGGEDDVWQFALVSGYPILTNGKDGIWYHFGSTNYFQPITAFTSNTLNAPIQVKGLSSCMNRLVVSNVYSSLGVDPDRGWEEFDWLGGRVQWSEMGNPTMWELNMTNKAGYFDLMPHETGVSKRQTIRAQISDQNRMYFFIDRGVWVTDFSEPTKFFINTSPEAEIISRRSVCKVERDIYWIGNKDIYRLNGNSVSPIGLPIRNDLFSNINMDALQRSFCFHNRPKWEVWFCVPSSSSTEADTGYVYNYELDNWTVTSVDFTSVAEDCYDEIPFVTVGNKYGEVLRLDYGNNNYYGGLSRAINGYIETGDMYFDSLDVTKKISDVIPDLGLQDDVTEIMIQVGVKNRLADTIRWSDPVPFSIGVSDFCDFNGFRKDGKFVRIRFYSDQLDTPWSLAGYSLKYELGGTR